MADDDSFFSKKVGPLPMGVWIAVIAGALGLAYYLNRNGGLMSGSNTKQLPQPMISTAGVAGVGRNAAGWSYSPPPPTHNPKDNTPTTNNEWGQDAVQYLISHNYPPNLADSAVRNYLGGQQLTANEQALIAEVLKALGEPPQLVATHPKPPPNEQPVTPKPKPQPKPQPKPRPKPQPKPKPQYRYITVGHFHGPNSTLWDIAGRYLGNHNKWHEIYNLNRDKISNPNLIYPGQRLRIPAN
jgi:cell division protein FtsN